MANSDKNLVITPNVGSAGDDPKITFSGADSTLGAQTLHARIYPTSNGTFSIEGSAGQLFSVTNSLTGTIYSVNDISGLPAIEVFDSGIVRLARYSGRVVIGNIADNGVDTLQFATGTSISLPNINSTGNVTALLYTGAVAASTISATSTVTLTGGTTNGVAYLNGSKVLTTGTALTFDGTNFGVGGSGDPFGRFYGRSVGLSSASSAFLELNAATGSTSGIDFGVNATRTAGITSNTTETNFTTLGATPLLFGINATEAMRLTSTGLGIGTSSPSQKLEVASTSGAAGSALLRLTSSGSVGMEAGLEFFTTPTDTTAVARAGRIYAAYDGGSYSSARLSFQSMTTGNVLVNTMHLKDGNVGIGTDSPGAKLDVSGTVRASNVITSTLATGTAPFTVASTTVVTNLNVDKVDGKDIGTLTAAGGIAYASSTTALAATAAGTAGQAVLSGGAGSPTFQTVASANGASTIVARDANGAFSATNINIAGTADTATVATHYFVETATDGVVRPKTLANAQAEIVTAASVYTRGVTAGTATQSFVAYNSTTATAGRFDGGATAPTGTTRLNYGGYLYATRYYTSNIYDLTGAAGTPTIYPDVTTGSVSLGSGLTTGTLNLGATGVGAKTVNIGTSTGTTIIYGSTVRLPNAGTLGAGKFLQSDASGNATWQTVVAGATITNDTTTNSDAYYPGLSTATSGAWTAAYVSSTKLYYNPSTGQLNATNFNSLSDATKKENVNTIENATEKTLALRGVTFDWIDTKLPSLGVIAQEVEQIIPDAVSTSSSGEKSVNYGSLVGLLIQTIKEQNARIEKLESLITR